MAEQGGNGPAWALGGCAVLLILGLSVAAGLFFFGLSARQASLSEVEVVRTERARLGELEAQVRGAGAGAQGLSGLAWVELRGVVTGTVLEQSAPRAVTFGQEYLALGELLLRTQLPQARIAEGGELRVRLDATQAGELADSLEATGVGLERLALMIDDRMVAWIALNGPPGPGTELRVGGLDEEAAASLRQELAGPQGD